jgi:hypothetical protein
MHIGTYLELVHKGQQDIVKAFHMVADKHGDEPDIEGTCKLCASWSEGLVEKIKPFAVRYPEHKDDEPDRLLSEFFKKKRTGALALLRDLHGVWLMANEGEVAAILLRQAAAGLHDEELIAVCDEIEKTSKRQISWLLTRMKSAAPQALIAAA